MPKFYFSISDDTILEGTELPDLDAARQHARTVLHELMIHRETMLGQPWRNWVMTVNNERGEKVLSFPIGDVTDGTR